MALGTAFASIASSVFGAYSKSRSISLNKEIGNAENREQFKLNQEITARSLGTLGYRTDKVASDINRNKINRNIQIRRSARVAVGERTTEAARIGAVGRRPSVNRQDIARKAADLISDSNLNAQRELDNLTVNMQDTAYRMIDQLQMAVPKFSHGPSTMSSILSGAQSGLQAYRELTEIEKAEISNIYETGGPKVTPMPDGAFNPASLKI